MSYQIAIQEAPEQSKGVGVAPVGVRCSTQTGTTCPPSAIRNVRLSAPDCCTKARHGPSRSQRRLPDKPQERQLTVCSDLHPVPLRHSNLQATHLREALAAVSERVDNHQKAKAHPSGDPQHTTHSHGSIPNDNPKIAELLRADQQDLCTGAPLIGGAVVRGVTSREPRPRYSNLYRCVTPSD